MIFDFDKFTSLIEKTVMNHPSSPYKYREGNILVCNDKFENFENRVKGINNYLNGNGNTPFFQDIKKVLYGNVR